MAEDPRVSRTPGLHELIEGVMGPCPFGPEDPRYETWSLMGQTVAERQTRLQAEFLLHATSCAPGSESFALAIQLVIGHFDIYAPWMVCLIPLPLLEQHLREAADYLLDWYLKIAPRSLRDRDSTSSLKMNLAQRVKHWTAQGFRIARESAERNAATATPLLTEPVADQAAEKNATPAAPEPVADQSNSDNSPRPVDRAKVDAFIASVKAAGHRINRKSIWRVAGYSEATTFERVQRGMGSAGEIDRISKVLRMKPNDFVSKLESTGAKQKK